MYPSTPENPDDATPLRHRSTPTGPESPLAQDAAPGLKPPISTRTLRRILVTFGVLLLLAALTLAITAVVLRHDLRANLLANQGLLDGTVPVSGLSAPVTVTRDAQSVPSIHAANLDDLLFAQGYITAADRLFQMDALRRHGAGTLAEIIGPTMIQHDREQRILQLRAAADRAVAVLPPDQLHQLQAYANGVNAYIHSHDGSSGPNTLPVEFHILHYTPDPWLPRDSLLIGIVMAQDLSTDFPTKLNREALSTALPANLLPDLYPVGSWRDQPPTQQPPNLTAPSAPIQQIPLDPTQSRLEPPPNPTLAVRAAHGCPIPTAVPSRHERAGDHPSPTSDTTGCPMSGTSDMGSQAASTPPRTPEPPPNPTLAMRAAPGCPIPTAVSSRNERAGDRPSPTSDTTGCPMSGTSDMGSQAASTPPRTLEPPPNPTLAVRAAHGCPIPTAVSSRNERADDRPSPTSDTTGCPMSGTSDMGSQAASTPPRTLEPPPNPTLAVRAAHASPADLLRIFADLRAHQCNGCRDGSNNWVVAGSHTATGAPLLSNDMHLGLNAPDIWYEASLHAGGSTPLDVEGFTLPGVPFVIVGRNPYIAWGFTNSGADVQDVLVEHFRRSGSETEYERPDHTWAPVQHHIEIIRVRAGRNVTLDVLSTTHTIGATSIQTPIISPLYPSEHRPLALAWTVYDPSTLTTPFLAIDSATDAASLVAAFASFSSVSQNLVYADAHHIGYHLLGRIPIRGPATQRPRATQPFVLPNTTPPSDEQDESGDTPSASLPHLTLASYSPSPSPSPGNESVILSGAQRSRRTPRVPKPPVPSSPSTTNKTIPPAPTTDYTIGSPISSIPVDALDLSQAWSGYIPYDALPSVLDPTSGILATANARITPDNYPYFISNNWAAPYRVERIHHLLEAAVAANHPLTPADMLRIQMDVHSEFDLLVAQRLAYALDHSSLTHKDPRLLQTANLLRNWNGDVSANSSAAAITFAAYHEIWPMLLAPQVTDYASARYHLKLNGLQLTRILNLYTWDEDRTALEQLLQNTPARWLPHAFPNWNDFLTTAVERGLHFLNAPRDVSKLTYGTEHPIDIGSALFGSHSPISTLLGVATGTGRQPNGGDFTTVKAAGLHFGPSERFTADLSDPDDTHANLPTGESGNPASPHFLDQFQPWLRGTTFTLPLTHPPIQHTLTLTPQ